MAKQRRTLQEVKQYIEENESRLQNCEHHEFHRPDNGDLYNCVYICCHCGGRVDPIAKAYYEMGYAHGLGK